MLLYELGGRAVLGSRLRRLADLITADAGDVYRDYDLDMDPRWFPVFFMLTRKPDAAITELARDIGQSHAAVSQVVRQMCREGILSNTKCCEDSRVSRIALTAKGRAMAAKLDSQIKDVDQAMSALFGDAGVDLWQNLDAIEYQLQDRPLRQRVKQSRLQREAKNVAIVPYSPAYREAFKQLNIDWIEQHWEAEASDFKALDHPESNIIDRGGYIAIAVREGEAIGTCALIKSSDDSFELAKMAVADKARGLGTGLRLGQHIIDKARDLGASRVFLESNTVLKPAIQLYRKLGFRQIEAGPSPYQRCNIQMEKNLQ